MPHATTFHILFIEAHDSFSNNIVSLLETKLKAVEVTFIRIDEQIPDFPAFLRDFDAVVAGPGPGHPGIPKDVGLIAQLWQLSDEDTLPVLGICLGFQSLVKAFGGSVVPLPEPRHGIVRRVTSNNSSIFKGISNILPVQYHSLHALLEPKALGTANPLELNDLEPLAWDLEADNRDAEHIEAHMINPDTILMAVKHRTKPFYGIQFHPESICSDQGSQQLVENWWEEAQQWIKGRKVGIQLNASNKKSFALERSINPAIDLGALERPSIQEVDWASSSDAVDVPPPLRVISRVLPLDGLSVPRICDLLNLGDGDAVVLDAEPHQRADTGTHSIIGFLASDSMKIEYSVGNLKVKLCRGRREESVDLAPYSGNVFQYLKGFVEARKAAAGDPDIPFWGGLVGYISYEAGLETINVETPRTADKPDMSFAFVERNVVIDHQRQQLHVQSIRPKDNDWIDLISSSLANPTALPAEAGDSGPIGNDLVSRDNSRMAAHANCPSLPREFSLALDSIVSYPDPTSYATKILRCQDYIHSGDSYELCLTNQATVSTRHLPKPWPLYLHLRSLNAAPFSAYLRLGGMTLLSSSPERFMRWTRPSPSFPYPTQTFSTVQFRPIKGTVKRYPNGPSRPAITLEQATALLSTPKERAENLMIVDLIRHDLHGVVGSGNVCVPKLMVVEEYATLFQLVTVVEGTLINQSITLSSSSAVPSLTTSSQSSPGTSRPTTPLSSSSASRTATPQSQPSPPALSSNRQPPTPKTGIDVLAASLPPGSMTGAPKQRSCALLQQIEEEKPRGIYSGVVGYMDVGGGGDFSVIIRSAFRWDSDTVFDERKKERRDTWTVGAGGAITALSTVEGEWEEMVAKLGSTLRMFE
ncbi:MAG: hypothetical protein Q9166_007148 [cf. Caloplaca sp. 2 TL-2023]